MRNSLFLIAVLSFFFTSCQKEAILEPVIIDVENTIADRAANAEIEVTVESFSLQSGTIAVVVSSNEDLTEVTPEVDQTLDFNSGNATLTFQVNSYQVIGENLEITFNLGGQNLSGYALDGGQFIIIEEGQFD